MALNLLNVPIKIFSLRCSCNLFGVRKLKYCMLKAGDYYPTTGRYAYIVSIFNVTTVVEPE